MKRKNVLLLFVSIMLLFVGCTKKEDLSSYLSGKTFYNTVDEFGNAEHAKIWFGKDGSFVLGDNFHDGYYEANGTWTVKEDVCTLEVKDSGVGDFSTIIFEIKDEDTIILKTTLAGSKEGDTFTTTKVTTTVSTSTPETTNNNEVTYEVFTSACSTNNKSTLEIRSDGSFTFIDRNNLGVTEVNGTYVDKGNYLELSNFAPNNPFGESIKSISFKKHSKDIYILETDLPVSATGDVFTKDGACPTEFVQTPLENNFHNTRWIHEKTDMVSNDEFLPSLQLMNVQGKGYSFVFTENNYAGMAQITGTFSTDGRYIVCDVEDASQMKGFAGEGIKYIEFEIKDDKTLVLLSNINMSQAGDLFYLE